MFIQLSNKYFLNANSLCIATRKGNLNIVKLLLSAPEININEYMVKEYHFLFSSKFFVFNEI